MLFFLDWLTKYAAKDMRENRSQSSFHLCLCNNHIVATPHKFVEHGRQERYPANPKPSRSTYAKRVFIRGVARLRRTRDETHIAQLTLGGDFNLVFTRFQQQTMTDNGP